VLVPKPEFVCAMTPGEVVIDKEPGTRVFLTQVLSRPPTVVKGHLHRCLARRWGRGKMSLKIRTARIGSRTTKCGVEEVHEILPKDMGYILPRRNTAVEEKSASNNGVDGIGIGSLKAGVSLEAKPGGVLFIDVCNRFRTVWTCS